MPEQWPNKFIKIICLPAIFYVAWMASEICRIGNLDAPKKDIGYWKIFRLTWEEWWS